MPNSASQGGYHLLMNHLDSEIESCEAQGLKYKITFEPTLTKPPRTQSAKDQQAEATRCKKEFITASTQRIEDAASFDELTRDVRLLVSEFGFAGLAHARADRSVHDPSKVSGLLSVPRNASVLEADEDEGEGPWPSKLVKSAAAWRVEVNRLLVVRNDAQAASYCPVLPVSGLNSTLIRPMVHLLFTAQKYNWASRYTPLVYLLGQLANPAAICGHSGFEFAKILAEINKLRRDGFCLGKFGRILPGALLPASDHFNVFLAADCRGRATDV
ncbi:hypothetical protein B0H14DRAFT_2658071 [Mycena olivaceomarginata]|nr:hypothetical protein B0H14DRAFT_2658071 [Mycena olivaceomarginata]